MKYYLITERCTFCGMCVTVCPDDAVSIGRVSAVINQIKCSHCGVCYDECPEDAIEVIEDSS